MRSSFGLGALPIPIVLLISSITAQQFYGGLRVEVTKKVECTRHTKVGDVLSMRYRGTLESDGTEFDSNYGSFKQPFEFKLGAHQVIKGWDQGLVGMCIGEGRRLTIPPALAYGDRNMGKIPGGSTLIFETELLGIEGVKKEEPKKKPEEPEHKTPQPEEDEEKPGKGSDKGPKDGEKSNGECKLLGPFALLVQAALGILALSVLVWKRYRETPRRPLKVWAFDASKQVTGSAMLHLLNLLMSMFSSGDFDITKQAQQSAAFVQDDRTDLPNPCSFYLLNLGIDTTIGIPILVGLLRLLHIAFSYTPLAKPEGSLRSGNYGHPPKAAWWGKQVMIYFLGLLGMKFFVFMLFQLLPWIGWVGDWALRWTEGKEWVQITFVMLIFPLIMNGLQYYIIDSFIKDTAEGIDDEPKDGEDEEEEGLIGGRRNSEDDSEDSESHHAKIGSSKIKEANPTPVPADYDSDDERLPSSSSSAESQKKDLKRT